MGINFGDIASFATGVVKADEADTQERLKDRKDELAADRQFYIDMKTKKYESELKSFEAENAKFKAIESVNAKFKGQDVVDPSEYGKAYLQATNPNLLFQYETLYAENPSLLNNKLASFGGASIRDYKTSTTRDTLDTKLKTDIDTITADYKTQLEAARGDSKLVNAILGKRDKAIATTIQNNEDSKNGTFKAKEIAVETSEDSEPMFEFGEIKAVELTVPKKFRNEVKPIRTKLNESTEIKKENVNIALTFFNENDISVPKQYLQKDLEGNTTGLKGPGLTFVNQTNALTSQAIQTFTDEDIYAKSNGKASLISNSLNANKVNGKVSERIANYSTTSQEKKVGYFNNRDNIIAVVPFSIVDSNNTLGGYQFTNKAQTKKVGEAYLQALKNIDATNNPEGQIERSQKYLNDFQNKLLRMDVGSTSPESEVVKTEMIRILTEQGIIKPETTTTSTEGTSQITTSAGVESIVIDGNNIPLTEKNKEALESQGIDWKNQEKITVPQKEVIETKSGDMDIAEQVAKATTTNVKITPKDIGEVNMPVFETLESILAILPNTMSGQEIMDKYEIAFPINKFTKYSPSN